MRDWIELGMGNIHDGEGWSGWDGGYVWEEWNMKRVADMDKGRVCTYGWGIGDIIIGTQGG